MHLEMWEYAQRELNAARGVTLIAPCLSIMFILLLPSIIPIICLSIMLST